MQCEGREMKIMLSNSTSFDWDTERNKFQVQNKSRISQPHLPLVKHFCITLRN
jgi:hypothetical protein